MRWRPLTWLLLSVMCFAARLLFLAAGGSMGGQGGTAAGGKADMQQSRNTQHATPSRPPSPIPLLSQAGTLNIPPATGPLTNQALTPHEPLRPAPEQHHHAARRVAAQRHGHPARKRAARHRPARHPGDSRSSARPGRSGQLRGAGPRAD